MDAQWTEKYRPACLAAVKGQDTVVAALRSLTADHLPHLLFHGPAGTGKTSTILAYLREFHGDAWRHRTLALNASDERGIQVVRERVKEFVATRTAYRRYVILDEADSLTKDAQSALRRIIEGAENATFCLICNYRARIIPPLQSRCCVFAFEPLPLATTVATLKDVASREGLEVEDDAARYLAEHTHGDLRQAITVLQNSAGLGSGVVEGVAGFGLGVADEGSEGKREVIALATLHETMDHIPEDLLAAATAAVLGGDGEEETGEADRSQATTKAIQEVWSRLDAEGWDMVRFLNGWADHVVGTVDPFPHTLVDTISDVLHHVSMGASPYLQFLRFGMFSFSR